MGISEYINIRAKVFFQISLKKLFFFCPFYEEYFSKPRGKLRFLGLFRRNTNVYLRQAYVVEQPPAPIGYFKHKC